MADGKVRIQIDSNMLQAAKEALRFDNAMKDVEKTVGDTGKTTDSTSRAVVQFERTLNNFKKTALAMNSELHKTEDNQTQLKQQLLQLAMAGKQNTTAFERLASIYKQNEIRAERYALQSSKVAEIVANATKREVKELENLKNANQKTENSFTKLASAAKGLVAGYFGVKLLSTLKDLGIQAVQTSAQFEQLSVSFRIMTGSAEAGKQLTDSLVALASKTPMTTEALSDVTQTLLAFGESSNNIIQDLQLLGDITGGETQRFKSLALAFAQVGSTGRLTGQDLMQMVNQGFNPLQIMSEKTGKSMAQLKKEMADGKISFNDVKQAMIESTSEGGRFYGLMNEQSKTLNGLLSTNADTWQKVSKNIGDYFLPVAKGAVKVLTALGNEILKLQDKMNKFVADINFRSSDSQRKAIEGLTAGAKKLQQWADEEEARANKALARGNKIGAESALQRAKDYRTKMQSYLAEADKIQAKLNQAQKDKISTGTGGGFGTGGGDLITTTKSATHIKTAYEQLQDSVEKARMSVLNMATTYGTSSTQVQQAMTVYREASQQLANVNDVIKESAQEGGAYEQLNQRLQELKQSLLDLGATGGIGSEQFQQIKSEYLQTAEEIKKINDSLNEEMGKGWDKFGQEVGGTIKNSLVSSLKQGASAWETFGNIAVAIQNKIIDKIMEEITWTEVLNSVKAVGKALGGWLGFAKGGAFENGVQKFASGGVVNRPTTFAMAGGKTGLMGEAGAEAIMPLKRTASGDLGIQATQPNINIYNQSGAQIETVERPDGDIDLFIKRVNNALSNERTQQGFSNALRRNDTRGLQAS